MADDKKLDEIIELRREKDKRLKMREDIKEFERQRRAMENIKNMRPPMPEGMRGLSDIEKGLMAGAPRLPQGFVPRPRSRELTPEEAARMERLRDEFHGKTRRGTTQLKKGGKVKKGYHKMPDGKIMKNSAHKKTAKCTRGDGCAKKGKTKGRMV